MKSHCLKYIIITMELSDDNTNNGILRLKSPDVEELKGCEPKKTLK